MNRNRARLGTILLAAAVALAMLALPGIAAAKDRNHDRIPDRWEKRHHLSLAAKQTQRDQDRDHLRNRAEFMAGDNPRDSDSDDDGVADGEENAGTIQSFDAEKGKLVIALFGGDTVSGLVTSQTEIKCDDDSTASASHDGGDSGDDEGSSGPGHGVDEPDDDNGQGDEPGDDDGGHHDDDGEAANCTTANLVPGAIVHEADLAIENGSATFEEVELAG